MITILKVISFLIVLIPLSSFGQSIHIQLPENPIIDTIPLEWKGHNCGGKVNISEIQTTDFIHAFSKLDPGIVRWPGGNSGNSYRWSDHLNEDAKLNLKNLIHFLNTFSVKLQVVVNFGNGSASEAAEFVNLCNNQNGHYTHLRDSLLNSPDPIMVKYWEIGNESTDGWSYGWSWLGFQEKIYFQSGRPDVSLSKSEADNLYYYGGELFREGWVDAVGGLDNNTAILGDVKLYTAPSTTDTIVVEYPLLDVTDPNGVRVYRTPDFDYYWAHTIATQQALYDSIANPANLLSAEEFSWTQKEVVLTPNNGLSPNDVVLIEYLSTGHDGAFAFRDSMKAADPSIEIGYNVMIQEEQATNLQFQQDFAASPPDFMIKHPYASGLTIPAIEEGLFSEAAYVSEKKVSQLVKFHQVWNQREVDWQIPNDIGLSITEWNVALYDTAPNDHPIRGITSGLYIADYWARVLTYAVNDSIDLRVFNHFALVSTGYNFIHLLHSNFPFSLSPEGMAATMVMEALGEGVFPVTVSGNPQIDVLYNNEHQLDTITIDAIPAWGGIGADNKYISLVLINRDDENPHTVEVWIPNAWQADSLMVQSLYGTMNNDSIFYHMGEHLITENSISVQLPAFSVNTIRIHQSHPLSIADNNHHLTDGVIYPNPAHNIIYLPSDEKPVSIDIFNNLGQKVTGRTSVTSNKIEISDLENGIYFIHIIYSGRGRATYKIIKQ